LARYQFLRDPGKIPGGWAHVAAVAGAAHKFTIFDFRFSPDMAFFARKYTFWAGLAGGCFLTTASHGTDQLMVQRLLSARNEARAAPLLASWVVIFSSSRCFLLIGVLLFVYYGEAPSGRAGAIWTASIPSSSGTICRWAWPAC
jgi:SSS family solute:Na+ symporter